MWNCTGYSVISDERSLPDAGDFTEFEIAANTFCRFTSVLLVQFSVGGGQTSSIADPSMTIIPPSGQYKNSYILNYFSGLRVRNFVNIILVNRPQVSTSGTLIGHPSLVTLRTVHYVPIYSVQVEIGHADGGAVSLSHSNPDAKLMGIAYSSDIRTAEQHFLE